MQKSQLINILQTFSKKEIRDCRKWLQSPAHNQREDVILLFDYLTEDGRLGNEEALDKCTVFSSIFSNELYDDAKMRQVMYFLAKVIENFLIYENLTKDEVYCNVMLASEYRQRNLEKLYQKTMRATENLNENCLVQDERFYYTQYIMQKDKYAFVEKQQRNVPLILQDVSDSLDISFIAGKLRHSCLMTAHQKVYKVTYNVGLIQEVLSYVEANNLINIPVIAIYYYGYKMMREEELSDIYFDALKKQITQHWNLFQKEEAREMYYMLINHCIKQMNSGIEKYIREAFEIYRESIENELLIENGIINQFVFRNAVSIGIRLKEFLWVEDFIDNYQQYLEEKYRESFVHISESKLYYEKGDYTRAMRLLARYEHDDILNNINSKAMLIKIYYELEELDTLESLLESMRSYIHRKKAIGYHKSIYNNLIKYTKKLIRLNPFDAEQKSKLQKEIEEANPLPERQWLLEQLEKL